MASALNSLGPEGQTLEQRDSLSSDVFFKWLNTPHAVDAFWQAQTPQVQALIEGYVAGYNRPAQRAQPFAGSVRQPLGAPAHATGYLVKLTRRLLVEGGEWGSLPKHWWGLRHLRPAPGWPVARSPSRWLPSACSGLPWTGAAMPWPSAANA